MIDTEDVSKEDLAGLFRTRWNNELDLRTIKITLQMDILRCKSPELVRKEIWTHILAYNLIRTIIAQAVNKHDMPIDPTDLNREQESGDIRTTSS